MHRNTGGCTDKQEDAQINRRIHRYTGGYTDTQKDTQIHRRTHMRIHR